MGKHLWDFFINNIFKKYYFGNNTCEYDNQTDSTYNKRITCECSIVSNIPKITFIIGKNELIFKAWNLFQSYGIHSCIFQIIYNSQSDPNSIRLGTAFYNNYFIYFNYQLNQIEMLSYQKILLTELEDSFLNKNEMTNSNSVAISSYLILLIIELSSMSLVLLYCKFQKAFY